MGLDLNDAQIRPRRPCRPSASSSSRPRARPGPAPPAAPPSPRPRAPPAVTGTGKGGKKLGKYGENAMFVGLELENCGKNATFI